MNDEAQFPTPINATLTLGMIFGTLLGISIGVCLIKSYAEQSCAIRECSCFSIVVVARERLYTTTTNGLCDAFAFLYLTLRLGCWLVVAVIRKQVAAYQLILLSVRNTRNVSHLDGCLLLPEIPAPPRFPLRLRRKLALRYQP